MRDNRVDKQTIFSQAPERREVFIKKTKEKVTRAEAGKHMAQFYLSCELLKVIKRFFPELLSLLKQIWDLRDQRYITYQGKVLLMTRILSSIFYISSMRKTSEEFNSETAIGNIGYLCGQGIEEVPYWETINNCLKGVDPDGLQDTVCKLVKGLAFEKARIRGGYWQVVVDGTQLYSTGKAGWEMPVPCTQQGDGEGTHGILLLCSGGKDCAALGHLCEHADGICGEPGRGRKAGL